MTGRPSSGRHLYSRDSDDALFDPFRSAAVSPWGSVTPSATPLEPHRPTQQQSVKPSGRNQRNQIGAVSPPASKRISLRPVKVPWMMRNADRRHFPIVPPAPKPPAQQPPRHMLKVAKAGRNRFDRLNATPAVQAYEDLVKQTEAMELESTENGEKREAAEAAYQMGLANLSDELVRRQKALVRFHTLKNEVDIFQQHLDPFVFEMRSEHERQVNSSVYRHFTRMRAIQDMGIPIYSLGDYLFEESDRIITARTKNTLYRRIRRRSAAHFIDTELIPRPQRKRESVVLSPTSSIQEEMNERI